MTTPRLIPAENVRQEISDPQLHLELERLGGWIDGMAFKHPSLAAQGREIERRIRAAIAREFPTKPRKA